jgi:hypothetical protein
LHGHQDIRGVRGTLEKAVHTDTLNAMGVAARDIDVDRGTHCHDNFIELSFHMTSDPYFSIAEKEAHHVWKSR